MDRSGTLITVSLIGVMLVVVAVVVTRQQKVTAPTPPISTQSSGWGSFFNFAGQVFGHFASDKPTAPTANKGTYDGESFEDYTTKIFGPGINVDAEA